MRSLGETHRYIPSKEIFHKAFLVVDGRKSFVFTGCLPVCGVAISPAWHNMVAEGIFWKGRLEPQSHRPASKLITLMRAGKAAQRVTPPCSVVV